MTQRIHLTIIRKVEMELSRGEYCLVEQYRNKTHRDEIFVFVSLAKIKCSYLFHTLNIRITRPSLDANKQFIYNI